MPLRISSLSLTGIRQFRDVTFDFTDPKTGKPLDRVCLIGGNGTGKSTILSLLASQYILGSPNSAPKWLREFAGDGTILVHFENGDESVFLRGKPNTLKWKRFNPLSVLEEVAPPAAGTAFGFSDIGDQNTRKWASIRSETVTIYCPPDSELPPESAKINGVPSSNLNEALEFLKNPPTKFKVGQDSVRAFWKLLIALIKDREARLIEFNRLPENQNRTIRDVEEEFLAKNPDILKELTDLWEPILTKAGLKFDFEKASRPIQLTDNLKAYIRLLAEDAIIPYADLSTGIRSFLFRLGHLFTIFRFHSGKGGIILVDEPENSLYPDFLFDLVAHYERAAPGTQMFFATHSPIVAAQFKPEERFILAFDPDRGVVVTRGITPEGDDPNDVLLKDFAVRTLYGAKGIESWNRFRELDQIILAETDPQRKKALLKEYLELGRTYNFDPHNELSS